MYSLQELADRDAIRELLARYCYYHAEHEFDRLAALFTEDGCFDSIAGVAQGRATISAHYLKIVPEKGTGTDRKHFCTDSLIELNGDSANVMSQFLFVRQNHEDILVGATGRYKDSLVKTDTGWLFKHRKVYLDFTSDLGLKKY